MRIFLSCQQALRPHSAPAYSFWEFYFRNALAEAGHEIVEAPGVDWAEGLTDLGDRRQSWLDRTWSNAAAWLKSEHAKRPVDLFLGYLFPNQVEAGALAEIRSLGIPCVNFFCDNVREFTAVPGAFRGFDLHWVPEFDAKAMYASARLAFFYAPMPVWITPERRTLPEVENAETVFAGSHDELREALLDEAASLGLKFSLYGSGWNPSAKPEPPPRRPVAATIANQLAFLRKEGLRGFAMRESYRRRAKPSNSWSAANAKPPLGFQDYFRVTRESQVIIGINRYPSFRAPFSRPGRYSRLRDVEAPMLGACYLTEQAPGLEDLFEIGAEIETYASAAELVAKAGELQRDTKRRRLLRERGQRRALSEHTIARSIEKMAAALGLRSKGRSP
ncbi:MAG TPA: glycosyltransferase [Opitutaceae bacterium]|jgi:hypothetical protein